MGHHRKPLGTTCHTDADWAGPLPALLDYLVTTAGTWYRIVGIEEMGNPLKVGLELERVADQQATGDYVCDRDGSLRRAFPFEWYPRMKRAAA